MTHPTRPTKRMLDFLQWMQREGVVSMFPAERARIWKRALKLGLVEVCGREPWRFGMARYRLSAAGIEALRGLG